MNALTSKDAVRLAELERIIESGLPNFMNVGRALFTIQEERLYKATHKTFPEYCRERWGMGKSRAYQLIAAYQIGQDSSTSGGHSEPKNERQARNLISANRLAELKRKALAGLSPTEQAEVIEAEELRLKRNAMPHVHGGQGRQERMGQIERVGKRWRALVEGLGDEASPILKRFDSIMEAIRELPE